MHFFRFKLNPSRSPQGFSCIALGVVYHPGRNSPAESDGQNLLNRITTAEATFPNCGFIIVGDFNRLNTSHLQNHIELKHLMKFPTKGQATLDLLTNMSDHLSTPESFPPFGLSDHGTVIVQPKERVPHQHTRKSVTIKGTRESKKSSLGQYIGSIDWSHVNDQSTCEEKASDFRLTGGNWHEQHHARNDHQSLPQERPLDVSEAEGANTHALDHLSFQ